MSLAGKGRTLLACALVAWALGCESEEIPAYGDTGCVAGCGDAASSATTTSSSTGPSTCMVDSDCNGVSFNDDVFPLLNAGGPGKCASSGCHDVATGNPPLNLGASAASAYAALAAYQLQGATAQDSGPYVAPCNPEGSRLLCNLSVEGGSNEFGACASLMPLSPGVPISVADLQTIADWIECGAPNN